MTTRDYSTTASDNTQLNTITVSNSMLANKLDNSIRRLMADAAFALLDTATAVDTTGSGNTFLLTTEGVATVLADNIRVLFRANFENTGDSTLNVDGLGAVDLKVYTRDGIAFAGVGQIQSGGVYDVVYVSALSSFIVLNPSEYQTVKTLIRFDGTGTVSITSSRNVDSLVDNGTGDYTVNLDVDMADANYVAVSSVLEGTSALSGLPDIVAVSDRLAGSFSVKTADPTSSSDVTLVADDKALIDVAVFA